MGDLFVAVSPTYVGTQRHSHINKAASERTNTRGAKEKYKGVVAN